MGAFRDYDNNPIPAVIPKPRQKVGAVSHHERGYRPNQTRHPQHTPPKGVRQDMTPEQRALRARIAGLLRTTKPGYDGRQATAPAKKGLWAKLEREVDPEGQLTPEERHKRAVNLWQARMLQGRLRKSFNNQDKE